MANAALETAPSTRPAPFGTAFAAHMTLARFGDGVWTPAELTAVTQLSLHPGSHVLHYGSACFEGLKAYRWEDGGIRVFRLDRHAARLRQSAGLLCLPCPDEQTVTAMLRTATAANAAETPPPPGALYIRPTLIGTEANIGAAGAPSQEALFYVLCSPVGDYFAGGERPLRILLETEGMRAVPGYGQAKAGGNYAAALRHVMQAKREHGADQVLFCPGGDVQETGASNFLLIGDGEIVTKPLDGSFLHGVTRDSILRLGAHLGYRINERSFSVDELLEYTGRGYEAALSGTAAVLTGVGTFIHQGRELSVGDGRTGPDTRRLRQALTAIQFGQAEDLFGWTTRVD